MFDSLLDIDLWLETLAGAFDLAGWLLDRIDYYEAAGQEALWDALPWQGKLVMTAVLFAMALETWKRRLRRVGNALFK